MLTMRRISFHAGLDLMKAAYEAKPDAALPVLASSLRDSDGKAFSSEREILYQVLFDMKKDMNDLKKLVHDIMNGQQPVVPATETQFAPSFISHSDNVFKPGAAPVDIISDKMPRETKSFVNRDGLIGLVKRRILDLDLETMGKPFVHTGFALPGGGTLRQAQWPVGDGRSSLARCPILSRTRLADDILV